MGGSQTLVYAVPVTEKPNGESPIFRNPMSQEKLLDRTSTNCTTMKEVLLQSIAKHGHHNCLGRIVKSETGASVEYLSYSTLLVQAQKIGSGILHLDLPVQDQYSPHSFVGIYCKNRPEWTIVDVACVLYNLVSVPISDTLGDENITYVLRHTGLTSIFVNSIGLVGLSKTKDLCAIKNIVCMDAFTPAQVEEFQARGVRLLHWLQVMTDGEIHPTDFAQQQFDPKPQDCITISYTSGTTGPPKGAMLSHRNFVSFIASIEFDRDVHFGPEDVSLSYLPLQHVLERELVYGLLSGGSTIVFYSGDIVKGLKDDLALVRPTVFVSVPRLFSRFHDVIRGKFDALTGITKKGLEHALAVKLANLKADGTYTHRVYDPIFFEKTKQALGGRVRLMISGSAPLIPSVQEFMKVVLCCSLQEGYGQTESTGAAMISAAHDGSLKHVGGPTVALETQANTEYKLVDIPEMNYVSTHRDQQGEAVPQGEIWLRGPGIFLGYYRDDEKTREALTADGWLKTGDVGEQTAGTRALRIIDRKKNIFKLQQGEYVAPEKVENIYLKCPGVAEIFLHGDSTETFVVGVIVPHKEWVEKTARELAVEGAFEALCQSVAIRTQMVKVLNQLGKEGGLASFEQIKNVYLEPVSLMTKGVLTNTMKVQRFQAKVTYKQVIADLYREGMLKAEK